jgi:hypothetical protein
VVEIDPDVIALSESFGVPDGKRLAIVQADAAAYLPEAEGKPRRAYRFRNRRRAPYPTGRGARLSLPVQYHRVSVHPGSAFGAGRAIRLTD